MNRAPLEQAWAAPRCGAMSKRTRNPCKAPAMKNGRCRFHGGKSAGARTTEGIERARQAPLKHGLYSAEAKADRHEARRNYRLMRDMIAEFERDFG
jgi:hypothetical protein